MELRGQHMLILDWIIDYGVTQAQNGCPFRGNFIRITTIHSITIAFRMDIHRYSRCMVGFLLTCNTGYQIILTASEIPFMLYIKSILTCLIACFSRLSLGRIVHPARTTHRTVIIEQGSCSTLVLIN